MWTTSNLEFKLFILDVISINSFNFKSAQDNVKKTLEGQAGFFHCQSFIQKFLPISN